MRQLFFMNSLTNKRILIFFTVYLQAEYLNANSFLQNKKIDKKNSLYY